MNTHKMFGHFPGSKEILGEKNFDFINNYFRESNRILYNELKIKDLEKYNYPL